MTLFTRICKCLSSKYILLLMLSVSASAMVQAQCNPNAAITHTGGNCANSDTLILTGTDSVIQITWYNGPNIVSAGTDTSYLPTAAGSYYAIVQAGNCADTTTSIIVAAETNPAISITATPGDSVCSGSVVSFASAITDGGANPLYIWDKNGISVSTASTYTDSMPVNGDVVTAHLVSDATCRTQDTAVSNAVTLTVLALPAATIQAQGSLHRCVGDSVRLTAGGGGTYLWSNGDTARIIHAYTAAIYDVTVTSAYGCTAVSASDTLTFTPTVQPLVTIQPDGGDSVCRNTNVTFYAQSVNGGTNPQFQWKLNGTNITNTATYIGTLLHDGDVISVVLTSNATCAVPRRDTDMITMTILPLPVATISGPATLCAGDTVILTASAGASYSWSSGDTIASIAVGTIGSYQVTVTDNNGCSAASVPVSVRSAAAQAATITQVGDSLYTTTAQFYQWYYNGTIIPSATGPVAPLGHSGHYQVATIDSNGCRSLSEIDTIVIAGMADISLVSGMKLYPNPSTGTVSISWSDETARDIRIIDAIGNVIVQETAITSRTRSYDLNTVATGIYYVQVSQGAMSKTAKLSIVR